MVQRQPSRTPARSIRHRWYALVRRHLWGMDIHPSAWIAPTALIDRTWPRGIHIAEQVVIAEEAVVLTHDLTRGLYCDTHIGARTTLGERSIILPGIRVGADCHIAPGAVVNRDVPDGSVVRGNPMQVESANADTAAPAAMAGAPR